MSTSSVGGAQTPVSATIFADQPQAPQPALGGSLRQVTTSLQGAVNTFQAMILKVQSVIQMIFAEILSRVSAMARCFDSFSVAVERLEEAFCPTPVASPDLGTSLKQVLASINFVEVNPAK